MSKVTRADFKTMLSDVSGIRSTILKNKMNTYIDSGLNRISSADDFDWLRVRDGSITAVDGTRTYALPADFRKMSGKNAVYYVTSTGQYTFLTEDADEDYLNSISDASADREAPRTYRVFENDNPAVLTTAPKSEIQFDPVPDAAFVTSPTTITFEYYRWIRKPTADGHYIEVPDDFLPSLEAYCLARIYENYRKTRALGKDKLAEFEITLEDLQADREKLTTRTKRFKTVYGRNKKRMASRNRL